jgi:UDP-3-O-[3-hydroxymyristoyl] glucosamine N-acyltransferase
MAEITYRLGELAEEIEGMLRGDGAIAITGVAHLDDAQPGEIAFVDGAEYLPMCEESEATALIVPPDLEIGDRPFIVTEDPRLAFSKVLALFARDRKPQSGVHPTAVIEENVSLGADVSIGAQCYIGHGTIIGDRTVIHPLAFISHEVSVGEDCVILPQTYLGPRTQVGSRVHILAGAVVGADGFGFLTTDEGHEKIPQIGNVIIDDDVEIGANTTVDRATVNATRIGAGTKIDDSVHVAHNVVVGQNCLLCGQVGIAGSTRIGDSVIMGGQVGVKDHVSIGDKVILGAQAGVISDIDEPGIYSGYPARKHGEQMRILALTRKLPEMVKRMKGLERTVAELEARLAETESGG